MNKENLSSGALHFSQKRKGFTAKLAVPTFLFGMWALGGQAKAESTSLDSVKPSTTTETLTLQDPSPMVSETPTTTTTTTIVVEDPMQPTVPTTELHSSTAALAVEQAQPVAPDAIVSALSADFSDVPSYHPYYHAISGMVEKKIIEGYGNGKFGPEDSVTRQQFAKIIVNALGLEVNESEICPFKDVEDDPNTLYPADYIGVAARYGITNGVKEDYFDPFSNITRAQLITMVVRAAQNFKASSVVEAQSSVVGNFDNGTHSKNLVIAQASGFLKNLQGYGKDWDPWKKATRGEAAQIIWNMITANQAEGQEEPEPINPNTFDLVIYGNNMATAGVERAIAEEDHTGEKMRIAVISESIYREDPPSNGLSLEDLYEGNSTASGFYKQIRNGIIDYYSQRGINALVNGRLTYEPEVMEQFLNSYKDQYYITEFKGADLLKASDIGQRYVEIQYDGQKIRIEAKYFVDASPEARLARMLGADYKVGKSEDVYNDVSGHKPETPSSANSYKTAPQALAELLTLKVYSSTAPKIGSISSAFYIPQTYNAADFSSFDPASFINSWTMTKAILPNNKRELNEGNFTDWLNPQDSFIWYFGTKEQRQEITKKAITHAMNFVDHLQRNGYPQIGIANINPQIYIRGGLRVVGKDTYTYSDLINGVLRDVIARSYYSTYDWHDPLEGKNDYGFSFANLPMETTMPIGHPNLLVAEAVSADYKASASAVRMESARANIGYAVGIVLAIADEKGIAPHNVSYQDVRNVLLRNGTNLGSSNEVSSLGIPPEEYQNF